MSAVSQQMKVNTERQKKKKEKEIWMPNLPENEK